MTGQQQEQQPKIEKSFDLFNPGGDPSVLRACAEAWRHMAHDLKNTIEAQDQEVARLKDNWTGAAADAFHAHWAHTKGQVEKALPHFATVEHQLERTAEAIQKGNEMVHHVIEELAITAAIGIGLSVVTAGFSDAVAAGAAEAEIAEAAGEITQLGQLLIKVAEILEKTKTAMEDSKLLKFAIEFGKNTGANFLGNVIGQQVTGQDVDWKQDLQDAAVAGGVGAALGIGGEALSGKVRAWSESSHTRGLDWKPGTAAADLLESKGVLGNTVMGGATSAVGQGAADGVDIAEPGNNTKHASDILPDMLTSGATGAAAGSVNHAGKKFYGGGEHRASDRGGKLPAWQQIDADGIIYAEGNAIEYYLEN
ncbi:WXG100 family type VII secretion target [Streptomyces noursei]|uniref:WXG100 family type VII secretion target n=1 Tax=Streptomyces noursei TaxID=1971 RepID=UPI00081C6150|nr:WXG repeat protein [Streptomyces noursei ATCC 11455]MCZ0996700.1 WXG100 family type VII secretion target [Streptomyces noursei]